MSLLATWHAVLAELPIAPDAALFRITEGFNVPVVRAHGTDRHGRDRPMAWHARGYRGPPRPFARVIHASTADEIAASLRGELALSALLKMPITPDPHLLVYRRDAFEAVHAMQYALRDGIDAIDALASVHALLPAVRRLQNWK
ncbi:MAG: hypothetical protein KC620_20770 [Myxococcales bacterium]|nr:hypothetical protein [Myxococcales bacterium]